jgi:hypothetical protein
MRKMAKCSYLEEKMVNTRGMHQRIEENLAIGEEKGRTASTVFLTIIESSPERVWIRWIVEKRGKENAPLL